MGNYFQVSLLENDTVSRTVRTTAGGIFCRVVDACKTGPGKEPAGQPLGIGIPVRIHKHIVQKAVELFPAGPYA